MIKTNFEGRLKIFECLNLIFIESTHSNGIELKVDQNDILMKEKYI